MKMENQYKTEGELYLLFNLLRHPGPHAESLMIHLMPLGWDNEQVIRHLVSLGKEFNFGFRNFQFDKLMLETTSPETYKKIEKIISGNRRDENNKLLKRFWNNKFSLADIEKELQGSFDKMLDQVLGNQMSILEAVSFDIDISPSAKTKIKKYLNKYIEKFINDNLEFSEKNIYTFERHKELLISVLENLRSDHGNELVIKSSELDTSGFLFIHCLMAFEQLNYLRMDSIQVNQEYWETGKNGYYTAQISLQPSVFKGKEVLTTKGKLSFSENSGDLLLANKKCSVPLQTNQYFLCKKMFSVPFGTRVKEIDILDLIDWSKDSKRSVYDAMRAVHQRTKKSFGVEIFEWRNNHIWIKEIFKD